MTTSCALSRLVIYSILKWEESCSQCPTRHTGNHKTYPQPKRLNESTFFIKMSGQGSLIWLLSCSFILSDVIRAETSNPVVETKYGKLEGYTMKSRSGRTFQAFSGIPYAKPPVGNLRFQPPLPPARWSGVKQAKEDGPFCIQYNLYDVPSVVVGVEDCLYLTLYTHNTNGRAPVMVHFHGGGYIGGNGARNSKPQYLMDEDVIVVDVNYRVGIVGFLSFEDKTMPGNQGMKDQVRSLVWVRENIARFGGDPDRVTIIGESAGAGSVYHHTVSPLARGLFHRAIAESGTSYNLWDLAPPGFAKSQAMKLVKSLNCEAATTVLMVQCLQGKNASEVTEKLENYREWQIDPIISFYPVLEPESPGAYLVGPVSSWKHSPVPLLMGTTAAEGLLRAVYFPFYNTDFKWFNENFERLAPISMLYFASSSKPNEVTSKIRNYYFPKQEISLKNWVNISQMYSDSWFTNGIIEGADKHTDKVYFYFFDYLGEYSIGGQNRTVIYGAFHTDEIIYLWYNQNVGPFKGQDLELSKKLVKLWTDFAKFGNPTPENAPVEWKTWNSNHRYLHIDKSGFHMEEGLLKERSDFWKSLPYKDKIV